MAQIHVLDQHTAELIAAGEVVERPASVVKELCENAIDAGARHVTAAIEHGGISLIQISDDGSGIDAEYIPTAFLRHATSKIASGDDLEHICTLGFRGEALASIASVARVELLTKTEADEYAYCYRISGGQEEGLEPAARPVGTTFTVRDLFYNTPARMKFLKKDASEGNYVADVVSQLALSHPEVAFKFLREGKLVFQTPGDGALLSAAYAVLSREFAKDLVAVEHTAGSYEVRGLVTPPKSSRASRSMQFFFVNGRFVKNRTMMAALEAAYKGTLMQGKFPGCVLSLSMPPQLVDVNVHPAKTEVRFAREKEVFDAVYGAVKSVLITPQSTHREFVFDEGPQTAPAATEPMPAPAPITVRPAPATPTEPVWQPRQQTLHSPVVPYGAPEQDEPLVSVPPAPQPWPQEKEPAPRQETPPAPPQTPEQTALEPEEESAPLQFVGEIFHTYIVAQRGTDLCLLDKHAAHERMLYEALAAAYGSVSSQILLAPVTVQLSAEEKNALLGAGELLEKSGLEIEDFGGKSVIVRAVPADVEPDDVDDLVVDVAHRLRDNPRQTVSEKTEWVLHSIACRAAVKAGDHTPSAQLLKLAQDVLDGKIPPFCPHGRPVVLKITQKELEKQFGRQG